MYTHVHGLLQKNITDNGYQVPRNSSLFEGGSNDYTTAESVIIIACSVLVVIAIAVIIIMLLKRHKCRRNKGSLNAGQNSPAEMSSGTLCKRIGDHISASVRRFNKPSRQNPCVSSPEGCVEQPMISSEECETTHPRLMSTDHQVKYETPDEIPSEVYETLKQLSGDQDSLEENKDTVSKLVNISKERNTGDSTTPRKRMNFKCLRRKTGDVLESEKTKTILYIFPPRLSSKSSVRRQDLTKPLYSSSVTLTQAQFCVLNTDQKRLLLIGPPGAGKSVVLLLKGIQWLVDGCVVHIVSTGCRSRTASRMLYNLLTETANFQPQGVITKEKICYWQYNFDCEEEVEKAVNEMSEKAKEGLYIIAEEAGP